MKTKITLTYDFHNTATFVWADEDGWISNRQAREARARLCGISHCLCCDDVGARPADMVINSTETALQLRTCDSIY